MRLVRSATLLVAFVLLTSAATANAECAWLLCVKEWYDASLDREWSVIQTLATQSDCLAATERAAQTFKERMRGEVAVGRDAPSGSLLVAGEGHSVTIRCLPDTVDPRGPKGGAR